VPPPAPVRQGEEPERREGEQIDISKGLDRGVQRLPPVGEVVELYAWKETSYSAARQGLFDR